MTFEILKHTADVRVKATGKDLGDLLVNALEGMNEILDPKIRTGVIGKKSKVEIESVDRDALVVDFLSEILLLSQTDKVVWTDVVFKEIEEKNLVAEMAGSEVKEFGDDIKAVTYHGAKIATNEEGRLEVTILFDI
ncbi:archease [Patescibacteria group bacterium]|nr:archease [Patescibacteria group bacterium]